MKLLLVCFSKDNGKNFLMSVSLCCSSVVSNTTRNMVVAIGTMPAALNSILAILNINVNAKAKIMGANAYRLYKHRLAFNGEAAALLYP